MSRNADGLREALAKISQMQEEFRSNVKLVGTEQELNAELEKAGRVADYFELAALMCVDALDRDESCGGHFRKEHQTEEGEALRDDQEYSFVSAWEHTGDLTQPELHKEPLEFEFVQPSQRSYK